MSLDNRGQTEYVTVFKRLGLVPYGETFSSQKAFTQLRSAVTQDEVWLLEHPAVFTMGQAAKREHVLAPGDIPIVQSDRGGQVTYHGPEQTVAYFLLDLRRLKFSVRDLVSLAEQVVIECLGELGVSSQTKPGAPGVYVGDAKIAPLGFRVRRGCSYHGLSLNRSMALEPFSRINPCGYQGLQVIDLASIGVEIGAEALENLLIRSIDERLTKA